MLILLRAAGPALRLMPPHVGGGGASPWIMPLRMAKHSLRLVLLHSVRRSTRLMLLHAGERSMLPHAAGRSTRLVPQYVRRHSERFTLLHWAKPSWSEATNTNIQAGLGRSPT